LSKLRPDADQTVGSWVDEGGATSNLFQSIDEITFSDADYVESEANPVSSSYKVSLENPGGSVDTGSPVTINYRYEKDGLAKVNLTVELIEGASTVRASQVHTDITDTVTAGTLTLTGGEAASVTNWNDVFLQFTADTTGFLPTDAVLLEDGVQLITESGEDLLLEKGITLSGTYNTTPDPDELDFTLSSTVAAGTLYWVLTATITKPTLGIGGFDISGLANGSIYISGGSGSAVIDLTSIGAGTYYLHSVVQRTSDRYYTSRDIETITIV
jgi:hypothetical protein